MHRMFSVAAIVTLLFVPAVVRGQSAKDKLVGTWTAKLEIDEAKAKKMLSETLGEEQFAKVLEQLKSQLEGSKITVTFKADGTTASTFVNGEVEKDETGKWEIVEEKGKTVKIKSKTDDEEKSEEILTLEFDGNDKFLLKASPLEKAPIKAVVFTRSKLNR